MSKLKLCCKKLPRFRHSFINLACENVTPFVIVLFVLIEHTDRHPVVQHKLIVFDTELNSNYFSTCQQGSKMVIQKILISHNIENITQYKIDESFYTSEKERVHTYLNPSP